MLKISKDMVDDYLNWNKILIGINSSAVGALFFKFVDIQASKTIPILVKLASVSFLLSLILLLILQVNLVEHKYKQIDILSMYASIGFIIGWTSFLSGFGFLFLQIALL